jgi:hypothetical protein
MAKYKTGLKPFDPVKQARFKTAEQYGFAFPAAIYPIDRTGGLKDLGMTGNGPDSTVTLKSANPDIDLTQGSGDCGPSDVPAHANMVSAALDGLPVPPNTMTSDQVLTLYYTYQAQLAGVKWTPGTPVPDGLDNGVDIGDWLLWLFNGNIIAGFVALQLNQVDLALAAGFKVTAGWSLPTDVNAFEEAFDNGTVATISPSDPPNPQEGHCMGFGLVESPAGITKLRTWGGLISVSPELRQGCLQCAFAVLTHQDIENPKIPTDELIADLKAMGGHSPKVPTP